MTAPLRSGTTPARARALLLAAACLACGAPVHAQQPAGIPAASPAVEGRHPRPPGSVAWSCDFERSLCGMGEHSAREGFGERRSAFVERARSGRHGIRLRTEAGDSHVNGSGHWERNDLIKRPDPSYCNRGQEEWWSHSVLFPDDYVFPPGPEAGIVFDFHHTGSRGQANFEVQTVPGMGLRLRGHGGAAVDSGRYEAVVPDPYGAAAGVTRNRWYDFTYHVRWSDQQDGFFTAWLNGKKVLSHRGPTLYGGMSCYLKLANYHAPFGKASSVIHDRIVRGGSSGAVSLWALEP